MKAGAADFVLKPFDKLEIVHVVHKSLALAREAAERTPGASIDVPGLVGDASQMRDVLAIVRKVAAGTSTVLVRGETGTGKELVARAVHDASPRKTEPFIVVHCAALPEALLESELFGHEKGAFTGAVTRKPGRVELAHKGTLFLDEIGDVPLAVQVKLLRVLQERTFERIGGTQTVKVDVRFIAATHRDLEAMIGEGKFREDLFYRLNVVPIRVPPLREREGDIARLVRHFAAEFGKGNGRPGMRFDEEAIGAVATQPWPGNVRQLQNFVERMVVLADSDCITRADVDAALGAASVLVSAPSGDRSLDAQRRETEKEALLAALSRAKNNRSLAARLLDVSRRTLYNKLREHGLE
jgi:DNA-binding NtrC family response regulator